MKYLPILLLLLTSLCCMYGCDGDISLRFIGGDADGDAIDADEDNSGHACNTGEFRCQGTTVEICTKSYTWVFSEDCALTGRQCVQGVCLGDDSDGDADDDAADTIEIDMVYDGNNDSDDTGVAEQDTDPDIDDAPACSPGDLRCDGTAVEVCTNSYAWVFLKDCDVTGQQCVQGVCTGSTVDGDRVDLDIVDSDDDVISISDQDTDPDIDVTLGCTPNDIRCNGTAIEVCTPTTGWMFFRDCAASGQQCRNGQCVVPTEPCGGPCPEGYICDIAYDLCMMDCPGCDPGECCDPGGAPNCYPCGECINPVACGMLIPCCPGYRCSIVGSGELGHCI